MTNPVNLTSVLTPEPGRNVWVRVGTLLDGGGDRPLSRANVVYNRDSILFVGDESQFPPRALLAEGQSAPDVDLPKHTLFPGLIESHAHLFLQGGEWDVDQRRALIQQSPAALLQSARTRLENLLRFGVVAVRDAGDRNGVGLALSRLYRSMDGRKVPYVDSPGSAIHRRGRYGSYMAEPIEDFESVQACVAARVHAGADRIKLIATGIVHFEEGLVRTKPQFDAEEIHACVLAAADLGKQTFAHASGDDGIECAIEGGVDSVEHGYFIRDDQLARMRDQHIAWVPTFAPLQAQVDNADRAGWSVRVIDNLERILEKHANSLRTARALGVTIIAGSDAGSVGVPHGYGLHYEMQAMQNAGLSVIDVINAATGNPSRRLAFREKFGQIRPGYSSRFLISSTASPKAVADLLGDYVVVFDGLASTRADITNVAGL